MLSDACFIIVLIFLGSFSMYPSMGLCIYLESTDLPYEITISLLKSWTILCSLADSHHPFVLRYMWIGIRLIWWPFCTLSLGNLTSVPWLIVVTLLDFCILNFHSPMLMKYCFAYPCHTFTIIRHPILTCCLFMFSCVSSHHPFLIYTLLKTACLLFIWFSHLCCN